jgi:hypothetical protein
MGIELLGVLTYFNRHEIVSYDQFIRFQDRNSDFQSIRRVRSIKHIINCNSFLFILKPYLTPFDAIERLPYFFEGGFADDDLAGPRC